MKDTKKKPEKQVRMHDNINVKLNEIVSKRGDEGNPICTKQGVVAEYVIAGHKKECKQ